MIIPSRYIPLSQFHVGISGFLRKDILSYSIYDIIPSEKIAKFFYRTGIINIDACTHAVHLPRRRRYILQHRVRAVVLLSVLWAFGDAFPLIINNQPALSLCIYVMMRWLVGRKCRIGRILILTKSYHIMTKRIFTYSMAAIAAMGLSLASCSDEMESTVDIQSGALATRTIAVGEQYGLTTVDLLAGQHNDAGDVMIWNDYENVYVQVQMQNGSQNTLLPASTNALKGNIVIKVR